MKERSPVKKNILKLIPFIGLLQESFFSVWRFMTIVLCILWPKLMQCMGDLLIFVSTKRMYFVRHFSG